MAGTIEYLQGVKLLIRGVCPECSGAIQESLQICESHDAALGELCPDCGTSIRGGWNEARVSYVCSVCKHSASYPAWVTIFDHPAVVAFYHENGFDMTYDLDDPEVCGRLFDRLRKQQTLLSTDPVRIRVTVTCQGAELYLTLDGDLAVVDVSRETAEVSVGDMERQANDEPVNLPDTEECLQQLRCSRWPDGIRCAYCGSTDTIKKGTTNKAAQRYRCHMCERKFNDLTGTLFADHRLSIPEMFYILRERESTETAQIARHIDRSYKAVLEFVHEAQDISDASSESTVPAVATSSNSV